MVNKSSHTSVPLKWLTNDKGGDVGNGEIEEVDVGGGPHVLVVQDDEAGGQVPHHTQHHEQPYKWAVLWDL